VQYDLQDRCVTVKLNAFAAAKTGGVGDWWWVFLIIALILIFLILILCCCIYLQRNKGDKYDGRSNVTSLKKYNGN